jgi:predicted nucleotidyltransferase
MPENKIPGNKIPGNKIPGNRIALDPENLQEIRKVLSVHLPEGCEAYVFGSRVTGRAKKYSDVDIAVKSGEQRINSKVLAKLENAFEFSDLPYKVDIIDLNGIKDSFRDAIRDELVKL